MWQWSLKVGASVVKEMSGDDIEGFILVLVFIINIRGVVGTSHSLEFHVCIFVPVIPHGLQSSNMCNYVDYFKGILTCIRAWYLSCIMF